jgi:hypothetical protein
MTERKDASGDGRRKGLGRRRFLSGVGASGLATAMAVFGSATPASALVAAGCCNLCRSRSGTFAQCSSGTHYVWSCSIGGSAFLHCTCCEHGAKSGCAHVTQSWYECRYN